MTGRIPFAATLLALAGSALAWCPAPEKKVCSAFFESDTVFVGRVIEFTEVPATDPARGNFDGIDFHRYTIEVARTFKGKARPVEIIRTENASTRWMGEIGERRVIFARKGEVSNLCSRIDEADHVAETIRAIEQLHKERSSVIEGEVNRYDDQGLKTWPSAPIEIVARSGERRYSAVPDAEGRFRMSVPPGRYRLESKDVSPLTPYSRDDADGFDLQRGQCAQFFLAAPQGVVR